MGTTVDSLGKLIVWTATSRGCISHSHTSNIVPARLAERIWRTAKFQSSFMNIYFRLSGFQASLLLIYFPDGPKRCSHCTKPIRYVTPHFRDRRSVASVTGIAPPQPFLSVNRNPSRYDFRGGAIRYSVNIALERSPPHWKTKSGKKRRGPTALGVVLGRCPS